MYVMKIMSARTCFHYMRKTDNNVLPHQCGLVAFPLALLRVTFASYRRARHIQIVNMTADPAFAMAGTIASERDATIELLEFVLWPLSTTVTHIQLDPSGLIPMICVRKLMMVQRGNVSLPKNWPVHSLI